MQLDTAARLLGLIEPRAQIPLQIRLAPLRPPILKSVEHKMETSHLTT